MWVDVQVCPVPRGRGQADLRRGELGRVRNTGQSPLFADGKPRISDDRALKVTVFTPGGPLHLGGLSFETAGIREHRLTKSPASP